MSQTTLLKALMHRRVPQILGLYLAGAWIAVEFSNMIVERYALSQTLVDFLLVLLVSFVPTVMMLAWFHGAPGRDQWTRVEKIGIPLNVFASIGLLAMLFQGEGLGATTTTVTVTDEQGQRIERVMARPELRKRIAVFFLDNASGDPDLDWLQYGLAVGIANDLGQSMFVSVWTPYWEYESRGFTELRQAGFPDGLDVPGALMQSIAWKKRLDYFINGDFDRVDDTFTLRLEAIRTSDGSQVFSGEASGPDILGLAERLSRQIESALELPADDGREQLGLAERAVDSHEALRFAVLGLNAEYLDNDLPQAVEYWRQAVALDPGFARVHMMLANAIFQLGDMEAASDAVRMALQHDYRLTDDDKFIAKGLNYSLRNQNDKALRLFEMWVELYPDNTLARKYLASAYVQIASRPADALAQIETVYELDPRNDRVLLWMGRLHEALGDFDQAIAAYSRYSQQNPDDQTALVDMAQTLIRAGQLGAARDAYERAEVLDPQMVEAVIGLADIARREGDYAAARRHLDNAESIAQIPQQESEVVLGWIDYHLARGQNRRVLDLVDRLYQVNQAFMQPINLMMLTHVEYARTYVLAGETDRGLAILGQLQAGFEPPLDGLADVGFMTLWTAAGEKEKSAEYTDRVDAFLRLIKQERYYYVVDYSRARLARLDGDLDRAIELTRQALENMSNSVSITEEDAHRRRMRLSLADDMIRHGDLDEAREILDHIMQSYPADPVANLRLAQLESARDDREVARAALQKSLEAWVDADAVYPQAGEARELAATLSLGG
ncbi:MAG: tetratricopeptide repeat protein [Gammaproteobacteria bacterium]|jgi:tetratricopeptide (TPR) repeat protein